MRRATPSAFALPGAPGSWVLPGGPVAWSQGAQGTWPPGLPGMPMAQAIPPGTELPAPPPGSGRGAAGKPRRPGATTIRLLMTTIVLLAVAGLGVGLTGELGGPGNYVHASAVGPAEVAHQVNVARSDLPRGWFVDSSPNSPLAPFLSTHAAQLTPSQRQDIHRVAGQFEQCMGIPASADRIFGSAGSAPVAEASSRPYEAPGRGMQEVGTQSQVMRSGRDVTADLNQITAPKFPGCFGAAIGQEIVASGSSLPGSTVGTPEVEVLGLPHRQAVRGAGVELRVPVTGLLGGLEQTGFVLLGSGRVELTLVTYAMSEPFPSAWTTALTHTLETKVAAEGSGTGL